MSSSSALLWIGRAFLLLQFVTEALSWGKEGHYAVCKIAEAYLNEDAAAAVNELLPEYAEGDLASLCSWADNIKWRYRWSSALHYVDTPDFLCNYEFSRDCHDSAGHRNSCVVAAIYNYTDQISSEYHNPGAVTNYNLTEALLFLSHFIGDIHQPLHVGFVGDEGGNTIIVHWYTRKANLHHVWDTSIIQSAMSTFYESDLTTMIKSIRSNITDNQLPIWGDCRGNETVCPNLFASESISLACKYAYRNATPGSTLKDDYFLSRLPIVEERLAQAGVRLAASLNRIFTPKVKTARIAVS
ncbi:Endonuclease 4 [Linum grandiflorum]